MLISSIHSDILKNKISMKALVKNALGKENIRLDEVDKADRVEEKEVEQLNLKNEIDLDEK